MMYYASTGNITALRVMAENDLVHMSVPIIIACTPKYIINYIPSIILSYNYVCVCLCVNIVSRVTLDVQKLLH